MGEENKLRSATICFSLFLLKTGFRLLALLPAGIPVVGILKVVLHGHLLQPQLELRPL